MKREKLAVVFLAAVMAIGLGVATNAMAIVPNCSVVTPVTESCGWVITTPGCYKLQNSLTATMDAGDCIQINSSNVYLDLNAQDITGTGATSTGNGIHVLAQTIPGAVAITNVAIQGGRSISRFSVGVLVGNDNTAVNAGPFVTKVRLDNIVADANNSTNIWLYNAKLSQLSGLQVSGLAGNGSPVSEAGLEIQGGSGNHVSSSTFTGNGAGVSLSQTSGNVLSAVTSSFNGGWGFALGEKATNNQINAAAADSNGVPSDGYGFELDAGSNSNAILGGHANSNGVFGIWVMQSSANQISGIALNNNGPSAVGSAGIYIGCDGPTTGTCASGSPGFPMSNANGIDANIDITSAGGSAYGIAIDKGNLSNTVVGNTSSANATLDEYDGNKCGVNNWFANNFGTSSASCVH